MSIGPVTLEKMSLDYREYLRAIRLFEHNAGGINPSRPGRLGKMVAKKLLEKVLSYEKTYPEFSVQSAKQGYVPINELAVRYGIEAMER